MSFINELRRRNVFRVGIAYVVVAWLVAQVAELAAESFGAPEWVMPMLLTLLGLGLPMVLMFAWAFELTPEGLKREHEVDRDRSITPQTGRRLDRTIIVVLAMALAYFAADKYLLRPAPEEPAVQEVSNAGPATGPRSIAVLPLVNMSADAENEYFSDGLTEELLNILAKVKELQVAGRTSAFAFKGKNEDLRSIAEKLNVESILEGSVRKDAERVRITVQLINAANGYHLWSETYDRELDDIFAIQEEIATQVARALRVTLLGEDVQRISHQPTTGLSAYDLYLQGLQQLSTGSYASLQAARATFSRAIEADPDYLPAQVRLALTWIRLADTGAVSVKDATQSAMPILQHVLEMDSDNDVAHAVMARVHQLARRTDASRQEALMALEINPRNAFALMQIGRSDTLAGNPVQGLEYLHEAERIEPYSVEVLWQLLFAHGVTQDTEEAIRYAERIGEISPDSPNRYWGVGLAYLLVGDLAHTLEWLNRAHEIDPDDYEISASISGIWLDLGQIEQAEHWLQVAEGIGAGQPTPIKSRIELLQSREQHTLAADLARQALDRDLDDRQGSGNTIRNAWVAEMFRQGHFAEALDYYRSEYPKAFEVPPDYGLETAFDALPMIEIAVLLKALDPKSEQADGFLDAVEQQLGRMDQQFLPPFRALNYAGMAAARGDRQTALAQLNRAVDSGFRQDWRGSLEEWFVLSELWEEPAFERLIARIEEDMGRQRELALQLVGTGP